MIKILNIKFILITTAVYIPFTAFWFFWHNNLFSFLYYAVPIFQSKDVQNIWYMNFANALLLYGMSYFFFKSIKPETKTISAVMWGIYYNISAVGFLNFLALGFISGWSFNILFHDMLWAIISGALAGWGIFKLYRKF